MDGTYACLGALRRSPRRRRSYEPSDPSDESLVAMTNAVFGGVLGTRSASADLSVVRVRASESTPRALGSGVRGQSAR
jgi:hypothetical protein